MTEDPFGTRALRDAVLAAWSASPARFREDANAEEDHAHGYYRDRVVVELAQNAADAAVRAGTRSTLLLSLTTGPEGSGTLLAANTGAPLDAAGVASLASLRASAKRAGGTVGRFGVGFAAVRSVADEVAVRSHDGAVHFSRAVVAAELEGLGGELAAEARSRSGVLPALRLPYPGPGPLAETGGLATDGPELGGPHLRRADLRGPELDGWDTVVALGLRDAAAVREVRAQLDQVGDALLLALPGLARVEVQVDGVAVLSLDEVRTRWVVATRSGQLPRSLLADRPVEERDRTGWEVTWAVRRPSAAVAHAPPPAVVHAPTPTDEPCTVPALLVATFPLDPSRRHVAPGPVTDRLVAEAGAAWADLLLACREAADEKAEHGEAEHGEAEHGEAEHDEAPHPLDLLPPGLAAGPLDAALREAVLEATRRTPLLDPVDGGPALLARDALVLDGPVGEDQAALAAFGVWVPQLVGLTGPRRRAALALGAAPTRLADLADTLPAGSPDQLLALYEALAGVEVSALEELATLPVRLADGRVVRGARGALLAEEGTTDLVDALTRWGARVVDPRASHPLLERLGATRADAEALARHAVLRDQVLAGPPEPGDLASEESPAGVLLALLDQLAGSAPRPEPWWGEVLLPAQDGELLPARGLVLPGSPAADWFEPEVLPVLDDRVAGRHRDGLVLAGVRAGIAVERLDARLVADALSDLDDPDDDATLVTDALDGWGAYLEHLEEVLEGEDLADRGELVVVADLDAVRGEAWGEVMTALTRGGARHAVVEPWGRGADGRAVPSYTAWWLRHRGGPGPRRPMALPGADGGATRLLAPVPEAWAGLDEELLRALGAVRDLAELEPDGWTEVLEALPAVGSPVELTFAVAVWRGLAALAVRHPETELDPARLPALLADGTAGIVETPQAAVATPLWSAHPAVRPALVVPAEATGLAQVLDVDRAEDRADGSVTSHGAVLDLDPALRAGLGGLVALPGTWVEHEDLRVDGEQVDGWVDAAGTVHAATSQGLAVALATLVGWEHRDRLLRLLADPRALPEVLLELAGDLAP